MPACSPHCPSNGERQAGKLLRKAILKSFGVTRLEIKPESTAPEADALTNLPSELSNINQKLFNCGLHSPIKACNLTSLVIKPEINAVQLTSCTKKQQKMNNIRSQI